ncbi:unnamed protein product, partial [Candidula unifasciata]
IRNEENKERSLEETFRKTVESTQKEKYALNRKVAQLTADLEVVKSEKLHAVSRQKILEERIRTLEKEVSNKMVKFDGLVKEVEDSADRLMRYEAQTSHQRRELEFKHQEIENVRRELRELWLAHNQLTEHSGQQADLIRQLQSLQQDTQTMLKNQEDAFCMENSSLQKMFTDVSTRYESAKRTEADLRQQILELKKSLMDKDDIISSLQSQQESVYPSCKHESENRQFGGQLHYSGSFLDILQAVDEAEKQKNAISRTRGRSLNRLFDLDNRNSPDIDMKRTRSLSPPTKDTEPRLEPCDVRKVAQLQKAYDLKVRQLEEMRRAHDKRLQRFQNLQASYRLVREELKSLEFSRGVRPKKPKRADPRSLQKENSDQVWNELAYLKAENRTLQVDTVSLQEEVDLLRVQACHDVAAVHELKMALQSQKEEYEFQLRSLCRKSRDKRETDKQLSLLKSQVHSKTVHIEKLERDIMRAVSQRDDLIQEKSKIISGLTSTQQEASKYRMELADMKHQLQSLRHKLEDVRQKSHDAKVAQDNRNAFYGSDDLVSAVASSLMTKNRRKNHKVPAQQTPLSHSAEDTSGLDNGSDEEWEEVCEPGNSESESQPSSLGKTIAKHSRVKIHRVKGLQPDILNKKTKPHRIPIHRPVRTTANKRISERAAGHTKLPLWISCPVDHGAQREFATSPIAFINPTSSSLSPLTSQPAAFTTTPPPPCLTSAASTNHSARRTAESRSMAALRQRMSRLQQQVSVLKKAKASAAQSEESLRETVDKLKVELSSAYGRLKAAKQHIQKLQVDLEKLQTEKQVLDDGSSSNKADTKTEVSADVQEIKILEAKLKVALNEASKQSVAMKAVKTENESLHDQVKTLHDRINHLERDITQKRNLLESQRVKLKQVQDVSKADAENLEDLQTKQKLLTDTNNKMKVQLESLKNRLTAIMKEKKQYEEKLIKVSLELDLKTKQLQEACTQRVSLETALADLEASAKHQLHGLASQSEAAIDVAREKLFESQTRLTQFYTVLKILTSELLSRVDDARLKFKEVKMAEEQTPREGDLSLQKAQDRARDILNLSYSDLEDIMSADGDRDCQESLSEENKKLDKRWLQKCEKLLDRKGDFVQPLVNLLLQKIDERADLLLKLSS